ncbi:TolC family protein [Sphingomonas sp. R86520]|uniref:TolC family protein n=1 Tax=Sphingomonas sp. R86520 TaxID=3093859 RepID=UPI0036D213A7
MINRAKPMSRLAAGLALAALISGCAVTPKPMSASELDTRAQDNRVAVTANQEPVTGPIDLYQAMARALKYNLDYRVEQMQQALKDRELKVSSYDMLPQVVASGGYFGRSNEAGASSLSLLTRRQSLEPSTSTEKNVFSGDLTVSWDVLDFGLSYVRAHQKADGVLIAAEERRKVSNRVIEDVRTAYYRAVSAQRLLTKLNELQGSITTTLSNSERLAKNRKAPPLIALTYQRELIEIEAQVKSLSRELQIAKSQLAALMNLDPGTDYELVLPPREDALPNVAMSAEDEVMTALRNRPELRQLDYQQRINKHELDAQILAMFPSLKGFVGYNADSNKFLYNQDWAQYGARSAFNLLNVFKIGAVKKSVHAEGDVLRMRQLATAMAVMTQVHVARARYGLYSSELDTARHSHDVQARIMGQIGGGYKAGAVSQQTLLREQMNTLVSEVRYDIAYADAQNAYANLYASMGQDSFTPDVTDRESVATIAVSLKQMWAAREIASLDTVGKGN